MAKLPQKRDDEIKEGLPLSLRQAFDELISDFNLPQKSRKELLAMRRVMSLACRFRQLYTPIVTAVFGTSFALGALVHQSIAGGLVFFAIAMVFFIIFYQVFSRWIKWCGGSNFIDLPQGFFFGEASLATRSMRQWLVRALCFNHKAKSLCSWTVQLAAGKVKLKVTEELFSQIEEIRMERRQVDALNPYLSLAPTTSFALVLFGGEESKRVEVYESLDYFCTFSLASRLSKALSLPLYDETSGAMSVYAPEELDEPAFSSITTFLQAGLQSPEKDKLRQYVVFTTPVPQNKTNSVKIMIYREIVMILWPVFFLMAAIAIVFFFAPNPVAIAFLFLWLIFSMLTFKHMQSCDGTLTVQVSPHDVSCTESWLYCSQTKSIPLNKLLRFVETASGLQLLSQGSSYTIPVTNAHKVREGVERALLEKHGIFISGNLFRRLNQVGRVGKLKLHHHGRQLVLDVCRDYRVHAHYLRLAAAGDNLEAAHSAISTKSQQSLLAYKKDTESVTDWFARHEAQKTSERFRSERVNSEQLCVRITLFAGELKAGPAVRIAFAASGWSSELENSGYSKLPYGQSWLLGDLEGFKKAVASSPTVAVKMGTLADLLPGALIDLSPVRAIFTYPGLSLKSSVMRMVVALLHQMLTMVGGQEKETTKTYFVEVEIDEGHLPICQLCGEAVEAEAVSCTSCETIHHRDCWSFNEGCTTYACGSSSFNIVKK